MSAVEEGKKSFPSSILGLLAGALQIRLTREMNKKETKES